MNNDNNNTNNNQSNITSYFWRQQRTGTVCKTQTHTKRLLPMPLLYSQSLTLERRGERGRYIHFLNCKWPIRTPGVKKKTKKNKKPLGFDPPGEVQCLHTAQGKGRGEGGGGGCWLCDHLPESAVVELTYARRMSRTCDAHFPRWRLDRVTFDAHFQTWLSYSSQKSCVKIWFGLVEPFKSYCGNKKKKKKSRAIKKTRSLSALTRPET